MNYISYDKYGPEYKQLWDTMVVIRDQNELQRVSEKIKANQDVYKRVEADTGVPWQMVGVIHVREAGEQDVGRWLCVLHNGERIVGTNRKTKLIPAGRGPFATWHDAAVDALKMQGFDKIRPWPVERMLWALEPFNGYGYRNRDLRSPYLWASTNHQQLGKYISDGKFSSMVMDTQVGCAPQLKYLGVGSRLPSLPPEVGPVIVGGGAVAASPPEWLPYIVIATVLAIAGFVAYRIFKKRKTDVKESLVVDKGQVEQVSELVSGKASGPEN